MKVLNSGASTIKFISCGKVIELARNESVEIDPKSYSVLHRLFSSLVIVEEEPKEVIIESDAEPIITEEKKPAKKRSKGKK